MDPAYKNLIVAGTGSIGKGLFVIGKEIFNKFDRLIAIDLVDQSAFFDDIDLAVEFYRGDICSEDFLESLLSGIDGDSIFVNVCAGLDTVKLRRKLFRFNVGYIDSGASSMAEGGDCFTEIMPYSNTACHDGKAHLICQGINPGMVEYVARYEIEKLRVKGAEKFDITIFEYDSLRGVGNNGCFAVGWNIDDFVEEMQLLPGLERREGRFVLNNGKGGKEGFIRIGDEVVRCRIIGHEDVWNLGLLPEVRNVRFCYGVDEGILNLFDKCGKSARENLYVPGFNEKVYGKDIIVVKVSCCERSSFVSSVMWGVDHELVCGEYGLNGVVYQTCKSLLFSLILLSQGHISKTGTFTGSSLQLCENTFKDICRELEISWIGVEEGFAEMLD